jgi:hypothetical protein
MNWRTNPYNEIWIADWCRDNGWTDWFTEHRSYWAFPPHGVMPMPIPQSVLQAIKAEKGLSPDERVLVLASFSSLIAGVGLTWGLGSPLPLLAAFGFSAIVAAHLETDED